MDHCIAFRAAVIGGSGIWLAESAEPVCGRKVLADSERGGRREEIGSADSWVEHCFVGVRIRPGSVAGQ